MSSERFVGSRRSRPIGASIRPVRDRGRPFDEPEIAAFDLPRADRLLQCVECDRRTRDDEETRGVAIQSMDDSRTIGIVAAGCSERHELPRERAGGGTSAGVHRHARGLVDDDEVLVLVRDSDGHRLRREAGRGVRELDDDDRARLEAVALLPQRAVDRHRSIGEEPLRDGPHRDLRSGRQSTVEPRPYVVVSDREAKRRHRVLRASGASDRRGRAFRTGSRRRRR